MARQRWWFAAVAVFVSAHALADGITGDVQRGRSLFSGATRTSNGGPPCGACHAIGGEGPAFAGSLGPDLSRSFEGLPADAVDGLLQDLPFPTMAPLYTGHPLTPAERADLGAFLTTTGERPAPPDGRRAAGWAAALAVTCLALMSVAARRQKGSTRARLMAQPPAAGGGSR